MTRQPTFTCPVCKATAVSINLAASEWSVPRMERALQRAGIENTLSTHYGMQKCTACQLEFASPMQEPGATFYQWLVNSGFKYPADRWEWDACKALIESTPKAPGQDLVVLDVGSGEGTFLRRLIREHCVHAIGVDHNSDVVKACQTAGLNVIQGGLDEAKDILPNGVDLITFWHVIEHVDDPVGVLENARSMLRKGGRICFSVPLSPMSYEGSEADPFNLPPHHLTRWNLTALEALAHRLGMDIQLSIPPADSLFARLLRSLVLQAMPPFGIIRRSEKMVRLALFVARHPTRLPLEFIRQLRRPRYAGKILPDMVFVCLNNQSNSPARPLIHE